MRILSFVLGLPAVKRLLADHKALARLAGCRGQRVDAAGLQLHDKRAVGRGDVVLPVELALRVSM
jgi:hypothetical protein